MSNFWAGQAVGYQKNEVTSTSPVACNQMVCKVHRMVKKRNPLLRNKLNQGFIPSPFTKMDVVDSLSASEEHGRELAVRPFEVLLVSRHVKVAHIFRP